MQRRTSFTLIELIIVIIVIGILATVAIPQYLKAVERAKGSKARHALGLIAQAEKMYRAENDTYVDFAAGAANADPGLGAFVELADVDADVDWTYSVGGSATNAFTATATRSAGPNATETITLDQDGVWTINFTP